MWVLARASTYLAVVLGLHLRPSSGIKASHLKILP